MATVSLSPEKIITRLVLVFILISKRELWERAEIPNNHKYKSTRQDGGHHAPSHGVGVLPQQHPCQGTMASPSPRMGQW